MAKNLEEAIQEAGSPVMLLWESKTPPAVVPRVVQEFTNWRDEQMASRRTAVLFDQSHHMADLNIKSPDALGLIGKLAVNSVARFPVDVAKQFVLSTTMAMSSATISSSTSKRTNIRPSASRPPLIGCTITRSRVATTCGPGGRS